MPLQPHHTFTTEMTRINELYWTSRFAFRVLAENKKTGRAEAVLPDNREQRNMSAGGPNLGGLRVAAILHTCSAFEHALASYFALCILYRPKSFSKTGRIQAAPTIFADSGKFLKLRNKANKIADGELKADYTSRILKFKDRFKLNVDWVDADLNHFQEIRNKVAHDQSLDGADDPTLSSAEVLSLSTKLSEQGWQKMLGLFKTTIKQLDASISRQIITDCGSALAVFRVIERKTDVTLSEIRSALLTEWHIPAPHSGKALIRNLVTNMGYEVGPDDVLHRSISMTNKRGARTRRPSTPR